MSDVFYDFIIIYFVIALEEKVLLEELRLTVN